MAISSPPPVNATGAPSSQKQDFSTSHYNLRTLCDLSLVTAICPPLDGSINKIQTVGVSVLERTVSPISDQEIPTKPKIKLPLNLEGGLCSCLGQPTSLECRSKVDGIINETSESVNAFDASSSSSHLVLKYLQKPSLDGLLVENFSTSEKVKYFVLSALTLGIYAGRYYRKWKVEKHKFESNYCRLLAARKILELEGRVEEMENRVSDVVSKTAPKEHSYGDYKLGIFNLDLARKDHPIAKPEDEIYAYFGHASADDNIVDENTERGAEHELPVKVHSKWIFARNLLGLCTSLPSERHRSKAPKDKEEGPSDAGRGDVFGAPQGVG